ncbi:MAG: FAD-dependent oxidoreductase, partial [Tistlia sp.]
RVAGLDFPDGRLALGPEDGLVLAVPAPVAETLLPGLQVPQGSSAIVNAHFRLDGPARLPGGALLVGLLGGSADWVFLRSPLEGVTIASVTVSAADALAELPAETLLPQLWRDTAAALGLAGNAQPPGRLVKEKRATFLQTPAEVARRPGCRTVWDNLVLAGDWTATGLPATIEGAIRSGRTAAESLLRSP